MVISTGVFTLVGAMFASWMNYKMAQLAKQAEKLAKVADATHTLVNKNMGTQLRLSAAFAKRVANLTNDPQDILIAREAETQSREHESQQAKVDAANPFGLPPAEQKGGKS